MLRSGADPLKPLISFATAGGTRLAATWVIARLAAGKESGHGRKAAGDRARALGAERLAVARARRGHRRARAPVSGGHDAARAAAAPSRARSLGRQSAQGGAPAGDQSQYLAQTAPGARPPAARLDSARDAGLTSGGLVARRGAEYTAPSCVRPRPSRRLSGP